MIGKCTAKASSHTWSASIKNAVVVTSTDADGNPLTTFSVPGGWSPPANYTVHGEINNIGDSFDIVFNEQIANPDGSFTENAVHMYLRGPWHVGDIVVGQANCGM